jgi:alpha-amylase/alpha-mannosidase (GH57 family)
MSSEPKVKVVFCWHMHQPDYRDMMTGEYHFPWTYLHAIKDYTDMADHLETHARARAVVNFAPILLEQLEDYAVQIESCLNHGERVRDTLLAALVEEQLPAPGSEEFLVIARKCLRANRERIIDRFPAFAWLADALLRVEQNPRVWCYLCDQFLVDLLVWYHLGWMGEAQRRRDKRVQALQDKESGYTMEDRRLLLSIIGEAVASIGPRYRKLAERGQVELAMSPYAHPIVPLLLDLKSTLEAMPDASLPQAEEYPGGEERARWHLQHGIEVFKHYFGVVPKGCWASEGALSDATLALLADAGFSWTATGDSVLHNSLNHSANESVKQLMSHSDFGLHRAYEFSRLPLRVFFRDDGLSDLIGFKYATWHAEDAVGDLIHHLENIARASAKAKDTVISIIMDGENAWEYFPENAWYFLDALYRRLNDHPFLELSTYRDILNTQQPTPVVMNHLVAGSWVYGTFSTWIGDRDKNRGWDMLCDAKQCADRVMAEKSFSPEKMAQIEKQLALCEGSDWFWWFGDYNPAESVSDFEYLFRTHLKNLYQLLEAQEPDYLNDVISVGKGAPATGGVMRQGHATEDQH